MLPYKEWLKLCISGDGCDVDMNIIGGGKIGGKAEGFFKAKGILASEKTKIFFSDEARLFKFPASFCIGTDVYEDFIKRNHLDDLISRFKSHIEDKEYKDLKRAFFKCDFEENFISEITKLVEKLSYPLAVRSSSILEDRSGTAFAGKYDTIFVSNRGSLDGRVSHLLAAIKRVYASTYNPNAVTYRTRHHLDKEEELMAILLQEAVGREFDGYFLPLMAGVGFSQNDYCWNKEIKKEHGLVRLVFGLGTRAVGRGYARIFSPPKPLARPEGNDVREIGKFSQGTIDVLDLEKNDIVSFHFSKVVRNGLDCYPYSERLFSLRDGNHLYIPVTNMWNPGHVPVLTFDPVLAKPWCGLYLPKIMETVFGLLEKSFGYPVDVEFAIRMDDVTNEAHFYLLQARPLSQREIMAPQAIPEDVPLKDQLFTANKSVPSGRVEKIEYIIYVDPFEYHKWPVDQRYEVARVVGKINALLQGKVFILMGPGRWGSQNLELGVPTRYSEISNCSMLIEVARKTENYAPEVSFGTHFFQDLIEDKIIYMPLYPDDEGVVFNEDLFRKINHLKDILPDEYYSAYEKLIRVINIPRATGGRFAKAALNGETEKAIIYLEG